MGWKNPAAVIKNAPKTMGKYEVGHTLMTGGFALSSLFSSVIDLHKFTNSIQTLRSMTQAATGDKKVSTFRLLIGNVPEPVRLVRSRMIKKLFFKEAADAVNVVVNTKQLINHRFSGGKAMATMFGAMGASMAVDAYYGADPEDMYKEFSKAYARDKAAIPPEAYAAFIAVFTPELKDRGEKSAFAEMVGAEYAAKQASPDEMMRDIAQGKVMQRVSELVVENEAKMKAAAAQTVEAKVAAEPSISHVDRFNGVPEAAKPELGKFTSREVANSAATKGVSPSPAG